MALVAYFFFAKNLHSVHHRGGDMDRGVLGLMSVGTNVTGSGQAVPYAGNALRQPPSPSISAKGLAPLTSRNGCQFLWSSIRFISLFRYNISPLPTVTLMLVIHSGKPS